MSKNVRLRAGAELNYVFDWAPLRNGRGDSDWLDSTSSPIETISAVSLTSESPGLVIESSSITDNNSSVTVKLSQGNGSIGSYYDITCTITTSAAQTDLRILRVKVVPKDA